MAPNFRPDMQVINDAGYAGAKDVESLDTWFDSADYVGAVPPTGTDWTQALWISYAQN
jgi:hypothetical protein